MFDESPLELELAERDDQIQQLLLEKQTLHVTVGNLSATISSQGAMVEKYKQKLGHVEFQLKQIVEAEEKRNPRSLLPRSKHYWNRSQNKARFPSQEETLAKALLTYVHDVLHKGINTT